MHVMPMVSLSDRRGLALRMLGLLFLPMICQTSSSSVGSVKEVGEGRVTTG